MPKLAPNILDAVFYLYRSDPESGKTTGPWGTGFIVGRPISGISYYHFYGVTNWHVSNDLGASIIRINTQDGKTRFIDYEPHEWQFVPHHDDISIVDLTDDLRETDQIAFCREYEFLSKDLIKRLEIGPGDDVFMVGLFADAHGGDRNIPCVRFGNLSMMASDHALIEQPNYQKRPSYLTDMRSRSGFSGSPVFAYRIPGSNLDRAPGEPLPMKPSFKFMGLLGIHCGQFLEEFEVRKKPAKNEERLGDPIHEGDKLYAPGAMNIVVPSWRVSEILDLEIFDTPRQKREPALREAASKSSVERPAYSSKSENG
jgi:hypothetical protein